MKVEKLPTKIPTIIVRGVDKSELEIIREEYPSYRVIWADKGLIFPPVEPVLEPKEYFDEELQKFFVPVSGRVWENIENFFAGRKLWRHKISLDTVPKNEKLYSFSFTWTTTDPRLTESDIHNIFNTICSHFEETYNVVVVPITGEVGYQFFFNLYSPTDLTLRYIWRELANFALDRYIDLDLDTVSIYLPYPPYLWAWGLCGLVIVGIGIAVAKRKK